MSEPLRSLHVHAQNFYVADVEDRIHVNFSTRTASSKALKRLRDLDQGDDGITALQAANNKIATVTRRPFG